MASASSALSISSPVLLMKSFHQPSSCSIIQLIYGEELLGIPIIRKNQKNGLLSTILEKRPNGWRTLMKTQVTVHEKLRNLRLGRGLTLEQLAEAINISKSTLASYESNEYKDISHTSLIALAKFYGVSTDYLLGVDAGAAINVNGLSDRDVAMLAELADRLRRHPESGE